MTAAELNAIIVRAKAASYVGGGARTQPSRPGANDLSWSEGEWRYLDSYFGGTDFLGQEVLWREYDPIWAMNYYGQVLRPDLIDGERAGATIKGALAAMYAEGRFLGGFDWNNLDARQLHDLGITKGDIRAIARGTYVA